MRLWACSYGKGAISNDNIIIIIIIISSVFTLPMLRLLSSIAQGCKYIWKHSKPCHVGIHWEALIEFFQMSTHLPGFQSFSVILHYFTLAKLVTSSIRVNYLGNYIITFLAEDEDIDDKDLSSSLTNDIDIIIFIKVIIIIIIANINVTTNITNVIIIIMITIIVLLLKGSIIIHLFLIPGSYVIREIHLPRLINAQLLTGKLLSRRLLFQAFTVYLNLHNAQLATLG